MTGPKKGHVTHADLPAEYPARLKMGGMLWYSGDPKYADKLAGMETLLRTRLHYG